MPQHEPTAAPSVLHMGGPSSVTAKQTGPGLCDLVRLRPLEFATATKCIVEVWCEALGIRFEDSHQGLAALRAVACSPDADLRSLPAVVPVVLGASAGVPARSNNNPRLAFAVLCRCSDRVFIRDKEPIITLALLEKDYSLALPRKEGRTK